MRAEILPGYFTLERAVWWMVLICTVPISLLAFRAVLPRPAAPLVQGPLAVYPDLGRRLGEVLPVDFITWSQLAIHVGGFALFVGLGLVIAARSFGRVPLLASAMLLSLATSLFAPLSELTGLPATIARLVGKITPQETAGFWVSASGLLLLGFLLALPSGHLSRLKGAALLALMSLGAGVVLFPGSPFDPHTFPVPVRTAWTIGLPAIAVALAWLRLTKIDSMDRRQWRPVLAALSLTLTAYLVLVLLRPELRPDAFDLVLVTPRLQALYALNTLLLLTGAVFALPLSMVLAVVRYRLFEIDILMNRALVYGSLTVIVAAIFGGVTFITSAGLGGQLGQVFTGLPVGQAAALAGVLTGTVMAGSLQPLRRRTQRAVDRRFYREKFDADQALDSLTKRLGDVVDRSLLTSEVESLLAATLQPIWASLLPSDQIPPLLAGLDAEPVVSPQQGVDVAVPLRASGVMIGVLLLGERKSALPYRGLDLAFLRRVADRLGPALRTVDLVERQEADRLRREQVDQELSVAARIQRQLLPKEVPQPPGWCLQVHYEPAREVGGDFYDFYHLSTNQLGVAVGDVTDKGMPAALVMASCRTVIRGIALSGVALSPCEVLARSNELLVTDVPAGMFITCLYGVLDLKTGSFRFANAGHNPPQQRHQQGSRELFARGMPLGLMSGMIYEEMEAVLAPGDDLILSSDGITEARRPDGEMFGFDRLRQAIAAAEDDPLKAILAAQAGFVGSGWEQEDDITLMEISRLE